MYFGKELTGIFKTRSDKSDMIKYGRALFIISVVGPEEGGARGWPDEMKLAQFPFVGPILRMSSRTFIRGT